jgi:2-polyprenyl-3-methyl-5-hydroxy-6-metoxy-1,4-benzoquinol methylase
MSGKSKGQLLMHRLIDSSCFRPVHIGHHIRSLHFQRQCRHLPLKRFQRILDAGCGEGSTALAMARTCPWAGVLAMDISPPLLPQDAPANLSMIQGDLLQLAASEEFDFIYCIDVLEHIRDNPRVMLNFHRALKRGGYLFLHMPDDREQRRIFPKRCFQDFDQWAGHEHVGEQYSLAELSQLLSTTGFSINQAQCTFGRLGQLAWELDRLTDKHWRMKIILMPVLKLLALISVHTRPRRGAVLVVAKK